MDAGVRAPAERLIGHCLALVAGVLLVHVGAQLPSLWQLLIICLPGLLPWCFRSLWAVAVLGILLAVLQAQARLDDRWPGSRHGEALDMRGHVVGLPERAKGFGAGADDTIRFEFSPVDEALPDKIRVSWYEAKAVPRGGECWQLALRMRTPRGSMNPGGFDYEGWLYRKGITATASVKAAQRCEDPAWMPVLKARQALTERLQHWLGDHPSRAMIAALTVGDDSGFSDAEWDLFRHTGTSHLVAISGFNVAIIAGFVFLLVRWSWPLSSALTNRLPAQKAAMVAAAMAGLLYGMLAGWDSPAQRAALMLAILLLAALPDRVASPWRVLALVGAMMIATDPASILSPGLWLSFSAVAAIFYVTMGRIGSPPAWQTAVHVQVMLSVFLMPLSLFFFQGTTWLGIPVNLVAVPAMFLMTPAVVVSVLLSVIAPAVGVPLLEFVAEALSWMMRGLAWIAAHAPASWIGASPNLGSLLLAGLGAILLFSPRGLPLRPLALLFFVPLLLPRVSEVKPPFEITALDVGQGLAVLVQTPHHAMLYDAGPAFPGGFDAGESVVVPSLLAQGRRQIDLLLLSHGDRDHAGGVDAVLQGIAVDRQLGTAVGEPCRAGLAWTWDAVRFEILHPQAFTDGSDNNQSCVLKVSANGLSVLLTGDIEREAELALLARSRESLQADVLIAPHHGSRTSSTRAFIDAVSPDRVIFTAAWRSHFGHPHPQVVARYRAVGAQLSTTGVEGAVRVWRDESGRLRTETGRQKTAKFWTAPAEP